MNDSILRELELLRAERRQLRADVHRLEGRQEIFSEQHAKTLRRLEKARAVNAAYAALPIPEMTKQQSDTFQAALRAAHQI